MPTSCCCHLLPFSTLHKFLHHPHLLTPRHEPLCLQTHLSTAHFPGPQQLHPSTWSRPGPPLSGLRCPTCLDCFRTLTYLIPSNLSFPLLPSLFSHLLKHIHGEAETPSTGSFPHEYLLVSLLSPPVFKEQFFLAFLYLSSLPVTHTSTHCTLASHIQQVLVSKSLSPSTLLHQLAQLTTPFSLVCPLPGLCLTVIPWMSPVCSVDTAVLFHLLFTQRSPQHSSLIQMLLGRDPCTSMSSPLVIPSLYPQLRYLS